MDGSARRARSRGAAPSAELHVHRGPSDAVVRVVGHLDRHSTAELRAMLFDLRLERLERVDLDLSEAITADTSALLTVIAARRLLALAGTSLVVTPAAERSVLVTGRPAVRR